MFTTLYRAYCLAQLGAAKPVMFLLGEVIPPHMKNLNTLLELTNGYFQDVELIVEFQGKDWNELKQLMMARGAQYGVDVVSAIK